MAEPPTSIQVYTIPTDTTKPYLERFPTINTPILGPMYPHNLPPKSRSRLEFLETKAAEDHLIYDMPEGFQIGPHDGVYMGRYQPDIHLLPDVGHFWNWRVWRNRAAIAVKGYHLFYLRANVPPDLNWHTEYQVSGKMFLLKVSKARDKTGRRFYVDIDCSAEELDELVKSLGDQDYFGPRRWEKDILAAKMSLDGPESHLQYIHTVTKAFWPSYLPPADGLDLYVRYLKDEDAEPALELGLLLSKVERVALPDTRPYYREHLSAQVLKRTRAVVGNSKFHAFLERAEEAEAKEEEEEEEERVAFKRDFTLLKVSGNVDRNGRWLYEDINSDPGQLMRELSHNMKQLISFFQVK